MVEIKKKNFASYFNGMTLQEAWEGDFDLLAKRGMPAKWIDALESICQKDMSTALEVYGFINEEDRLVATIYYQQELGGHDGSFFYPFVDDEEIPDGVEKVSDNIAYLTTESHQETIQQHACLVADSLRERDLFSRRVTAWLAAAHDIGKKYTAATNAEGELCFRNHAIVAAFIAGHWLRHRRETVSEDQQFFLSDKGMVATIYAHALPEEVDGYEEALASELSEFLGVDHWRTLFEYIKIFSQICAKGITLKEDTETTRKNDAAIYRGSKFIYDASRSS